MSEPPIRTDVLVIGAGPAGIAAAVTAAAHGRRVLLVDEGMRAGGQVWRHTHRRGLPAGARRWLARLDASPVRQQYGATVADITEGRHALLEIDGAAVTVDAGKAVILCTGARERFLPFPGWTLPGVVGVGGAQALLKSGLRVAGRRAVVAGTGPLLLPVAAALARAGARIALVAEQAPPGTVRRFSLGLWRTPSKLLDAARYRAAFAAAPYRAGAWVTAAEGTARVTAVHVRGAGGSGSGGSGGGSSEDGSEDGGGGESRRIECDLLCVGYGLVPATELPGLAGCAIEQGVVWVDDAQRTRVPGVYCAGEPTGVAGVDAAVTQGRIAGLAAAGAPVPARLRQARATQLRFARALDAAFALRPELRTLASPDTIVCRCEDVRHVQLAALGAAREAKLFTRAGMGPCQGRVCAPAMHFLFGWEGDSVRPPASPVSVGTLAGPAVIRALHNPPRPHGHVQRETQ